LSVQELTFVVLMICYLLFLILGAHNFFISNLFLTIINVLDVPIRRVQINIVWTPKTMEPSPWSSLPCLNVWS
jgi:hypothetical protein